MLPRSVLLADDLAFHRTIGKRVLESLACQVTLATDGTEAWEAVQQGDFDLVLLDVQMPEMNGLEVCRKLRSQESVHGDRCRVLALTSGDSEEERAACIEAGMDGVFHKPLLPSTVRDLLRTAGRPESARGDARDAGEAREEPPPVT